MKSDSEVTRDVLDELAFDPSLDATSIGVSVLDGAVTLTGTVPWYGQKLAAERAVRRVSGVFGIVEDLLVVLPDWFASPDADLATTAKYALNANAAVPRDAVTVTCDSGWLTLGGTVKWQYQRAAARHAVAALVGVKGITNEIAIGEFVASSDVKEQITAAFRRNAQIESDRIDVGSNGGTVTLRGTVHSWAEYDDATSAAYSVPGVRDVHNLLSVSTMGVLA